MEESVLTTPSKIRDTETIEANDRLLKSSLLNLSLETRAHFYASVIGGLLCYVDTDTFASVVESAKKIAKK